MHRTMITVLIAGVVAVAPDAVARCHHTAPRSATINVDGITAVRIIAHAGELEVTGRPGVDSVNARGTACASSSSHLERIRLTAVRKGTEIIIETEMPEQRGLFVHGETRLDLKVDVPDSVRVIVDDGSGPMKISGVAVLDVDDGSGEIEISDIGGDVRVEDGSGAMTLTRIRGNVVIEDGSGEIAVSKVGGTVTILEDGSGAIEIRDAKSVLIEDDGSGSIRVADITGDFTLKNDGSGGVSVNRVAGSVSLPRDDN